MAQSNVEANTIITDDTELKKGPSKIEVASGFLCNVSDVACPNTNHLELHKSGRKHRNRLRQVEEQANDQTARSISEGKRQQTAAAEHETSPAARTNPDTWSTTSSVQPQYQLPSPSVLPGPIVVDKVGPVWSTNITAEKATSLRSILSEEAERRTRTAKLNKSCKPPPPRALASPSDDGQLASSSWPSTPCCKTKPCCHHPSRKCIMGTSASCENSKCLINASIGTPTCVYEERFIKLQEAESSRFFTGSHTGQNGADGCRTMGSRSGTQ